MGDLVIDIGRAIDGTDADPIDDARLVVTDGRIDSFGPREALPVPEDREHYEYPEATAIPGLIDAHVHLGGGRSMDFFDISTPLPQRAAQATADLRDLLTAGFTTVRDVGSQTGIGLREAVDGGEIPGPRIFTSDRPINQTAGHLDAQHLPHQWARAEDDRGISTLADGPAECRTEARKRVREGADLIKIMTTGGVLSEEGHPSQSHYTDAEIQAFVEEAHRFDIPVAAHAHHALGIKNALRNGVDTIEHGIWMDDEAISLFHETDAMFVPTLAIDHRLYEHSDEYDVPEPVVERAREAHAAHVESVKQAHSAGVPIALGTDFAGPELVPHGENALEAELLVEAIGMDEHEAIRAGTGLAARTVPADDVGTLEAGNHADLVILDEDPLADIGALREIRTVFKGGEEVTL